MLRNSRPEPRPGFRDELEEELFPSRLPSGFPAPRPWSASRPFLVAGAAATALAAGVLAMSLAGAGPLDDSGGGVEATSNCKTVTVARRVRVPYLARSADGRTRISYRYEKKRRQVKRCP